MAFRKWKSNAKNGGKAPKDNNDIETKKDRNKTVHLLLSDRNYQPLKFLYSLEEMIKKVFRNFKIFYEKNKLVF